MERRKTGLEVARPWGGASGPLGTSWGPQHGEEGDRGRRGTGEGHSVPLPLRFFLPIGVDRGPAPRRHGAERWRQNKKQRLHRLNDEVSTPGQHGLLAG